MQTLVCLADRLLEPFGMRTSNEYEFLDSRLFDDCHSLADISQVDRLLGIELTHHFVDGIQSAARWHVDFHKLLH
jgi:hypothetical protein